MNEGVESVTRLKRFGVLGIWVLLASCVTVNIYFPAAEAESAARGIVRDVMGVEPAPEQSTPRSDGQSRYAPSAALRLAGALADVLISPARAQADLNVNTPAIEALSKAMRARRPNLDPYIKSGAVGLSRDARVIMRDPQAVPLRERNTVKQLLAGENADRDALYREIAKANGHPEWEANIRDTFARVWVQEALPGTWYQNAGGAWVQK